jgi:hypothetical protein
MNEIHVLQPLVDSGRPSYIQREKRSTRPSTTKSKAPKKKERKKIPYQTFRTSQLS